MVDLSGTIRRATASEAVADRLRAEIQRGQLRPGTHLRQEDVASRLGVSTTPVREAFQVLQTEGLLTMDPHRGVIVFQPTAQDVRESYEIREHLETLAIKLAIEEGPSEASLGELARIVEEMERSEHDSRWIELNDLFHAKIYELSGRRRLCSIITNLVNATSGYMHMFIHTARYSGRADEEHRHILEALGERDVERAQRAVRVHIHHTVERALSFLDHLEEGEGVEAVEG